MDTTALADLLYDPNTTKPIQHWFDIYPRRALPDSAEVTRIAPSPTGFLHLGALYMSVINRRIATDTDGVFFLRIEDTDTSREVEGARSLIVKGLATFGITFDEGFIDGDTQFGNYGPYLQTQRADIYKSFARELVLRGRAYPCFMTREELEAKRAEQEAAKVRPGYYGEYAVWRDAPIEQVKEKRASGASYVLRFKSNGNQNTKRPFTDEFMGTMQVPQNDEDFVLLKADGIPTYHFAHIVDDYLMRTTFVIRGNEWFSSIGKHIELWESLDLPVPKYGHISPINKQDGGSVRKLSKRKDPEADIMRYIELGYPTDALIGYMYRLANPTFDDWWNIQTNALVWDFPFNISELKGGRGPLIDLKKLDNISATIIAMLPAEEAATRMTDWAKTYDPDFFAVISKEQQYLTAIVNIERGGEQPRKDITNWSTGRTFIDYFFDSFFDPAHVRTLLSVITLSTETRQHIIDAFSNDELYVEPSLDVWVSHMKALSEQLGFATDKAALKDNPEKYHGDFPLFMKTVRLALTGKDRTPNLFYILKVMGKDRVLSRLIKVLG